MARKTIRSAAWTTVSFMLLGAVALAQPPGKSGRKKFEVPEDKAKLGTVYHVHPGKDAQVTFTSDAPLEHIKGTSNQVVGFAVLPEKADSANFTVLAGAFHLPVESLDTGIPMRNTHVQDKRWLDAKSHPNVEFTLDKAENVKVEKTGDGFTTYSADMTGDMTVKGTTRKMTIPVRITAMPASAKTEARAPGDLLAIRTEFPIKMSEFGVAQQEAAVTSGKVSDELVLDIFLLLSTSPPGR